MRRGILFDTIYAMKYGIDCAILLNIIQEGMTAEDAWKTGWSEFAIAFFAKMLPFYTEAEINNTINKLIDYKLIETRNVHCKERNMDVVEYSICGGNNE
jgi:hypothetical protein